MQCLAYILCDRQHILGKWDVEHIDSHTENPLEDEKGQKEWLKYSYEYIGDEAKFESGENIKIEIKKFIAGSESKKEFPVLWQEVISKTYTKAEKLKDGIIDNNGNVINENYAFKSTGICAEPQLYLNYMFLKDMGFELTAGAAANLSTALYYNNMQNVVKIGNKMWYPNWTGYRLSAGIVLHL